MPPLLIQQVSARSVCQRFGLVVCVAAKEEIWLGNFTLDLESSFLVEKAVFVANHEVRK